jgi:CubicO group peptidase (beta-lactamase class C family)
MIRHLMTAVLGLIACACSDLPGDSGAGAQAGSPHEAASAAHASDRAPPVLPTAQAIDAEVARAMAAAGVKGLAIALIDDGRPIHVASFGQRNQAGEPLQADTVMYGASLTKPLFAYLVMQLVAEGRIELDAPIERYLPQPLPSYEPQRGYPDWRALSGDERWRRLTARILLSHRSGFANFASQEPGGRLRFNFEPGTRYAYSGEGLMLLQFVLERGLGLDIGAEMQRRVFDRFEMRRSGLTWRADMAANQADGYAANGSSHPHHRFNRVRVAGSMDTTIDDFARFAAGFMRGDGLSVAGRAEMLARQWPITTARQFPTLLPELPASKRRSDLAAGLGLIVFSGPQGPGFFKGGHDDEGTGNTWVCVEAGHRCAVLLSNDVRAEALFPRLVGFLLGETGVPWPWEYGR